MEAVTILVKSLPVWKKSGWIVIVGNNAGLPLRNCPNILNSNPGLPGFNKITFKNILSADLTSTAGDWRFIDWSISTPLGIGLAAVPKLILYNPISSAITVSTEDLSCII